MKLVFLYGPPAVGKLTVAKELSKLTGFKIFHNHLTIDLVKDFFTFGTDKFWKYNTFFRKEFLKIAAKEDLDLIYTFCYAKSFDEKYISELLRFSKKKKIKIHFVNLITNKNKLFERVKGESRKKYSKAKTHKSMKEMFSKWELFYSIPNVDSLIIDNTKLSAKKTAQKIKEHYKL